MFRGVRSMEGVRPVAIVSIVCCLLLFLMASDPERYFPIVFISTGGRALVALIGIPALTRQIHMVISEGALAAVLVLVIIHAIKERRSAEGKGGAKPVVRPAGKPDAKPDKA